MGLFQAAAKFAGFAAEKGAVKSLSAVPGEAAAFIKSLEGPAASKFVHGTEEGFKTLRLMEGEQSLGLLKYKEFDQGYTVMAIAGERKGAGMQMRSELARVAKSEGKKFLISDVYGSMSYDEMQSWTRLKSQGHDVMEVNVPYAKLGLQREGGKFAYQWNIANEEAAAAQLTAHAKAAPARTTVLARDVKTARNVMESGAGHDSTTLLNRKMNSPGGSRRTSGAL